MNLDQKEFGAGTIFYFDCEINTNKNKFEIKKRTHAAWLWWLTLSAHTNKVPHLNLGWFFLCGVCMFSPCTCVLSGFSSFLPKSKNIGVSVSGCSCLYVAQQRTGDLSRVYIASHLITAGIGSGPTATLNCIKGV